MAANDRRLRPSFAGGALLYSQAIRPATKGRSRRRRNPWAALGVQGKIVNNNFRIRTAAAAVFCATIAVSSQVHRPEALMEMTANRFIDSLTAAQRDGSVFPMNSPERLKWHYFPENGFQKEYGHERRGIMFKQMDPKQRHLAYALMASGLSQVGFIKASTIMSVEEIVRVIEADTTGHRDAERFHFTIFGDPAATGVWAWRVEGHHVVLNFTIREGKVISSSPTFFGANPHEVPMGPHKGMRVLDREEDLARDLVNSLDPAQRKEAIFDQAAPEDIVTMAVLRAKLDGSPKGIPASRLTDRQREMLMTLIAEYADNLAPPLADKRMKQARGAPAAKLFFAWAGKTSRPVLRPIVIGRPTVGNRDEQGLYYRVQSPEFLIEYDNTQAFSNHSHSVWRDWKGDFGLDVLAMHHRLFDHRATLARR